MNKNLTVTKTIAANGVSSDSKISNHKTNHSSFLKSMKGICRVFAIFSLFIFFLNQENSYGQIAAWNNSSLSGITSTSINADRKSTRLNSSHLGISYDV